MTDDLIKWLFWAFAAVVGYGVVAASVRYVHFSRMGHRIMAAQAILQTMLCVAGLLVLLIIHESYLPG